MKDITIIFEGTEYSLTRCLSGNCKGCEREHYACCGLLIEEMMEKQSKEATA